MISQDLSEEPVSGVLHQSAISDMDACPSHSCGLSYCSHWDGVDHGFIRPHNLPHCFQPVGAPVDRSTNPVSMSHKEDGFACFGHVPGHGLSLRLGPELEPNNSRPYNCNEAHILENIARSKIVYGGLNSCSCGKHLRDNRMICDGDIANSSYTFGYSAKFHDIIINVLQKSSYLKEAQELLNEVVCVSNSVREPSSYKNVRRNNPINGKMWTVHSSKESQEMRRMARLVALQKELENRHNHYFHQMDELVSSFEAVGGVGSAAAYTTLTSQAMSKHFSNLGEAIITHIESLRDAFSKDVPRNTEPQGESLQDLGMIRVRQIWRPLRGLPEESVMVLRAWLFEHFLHPYPNDNEKLLLASKTGLTRNQISNWFINARVRLWKPMIEEMYREEFEEGEEDSNPS